MLHRFNFANFSKGPPATNGKAPRGEGSEGFSPSASGLLPPPTKIIRDGSWSNSRNLSLVVKYSFPGMCSVARRDENKAADQGIISYLNTRLVAETDAAVKDGDSGLQKLLLAVCRNRLGEGALKPH